MILGPKTDKGVSLRLLLLTHILAAAFGAFLSLKISNWLTFTWGTVSAVLVVLLLLVILALWVEAGRRRRSELWYPTD